MLPAHAACSNVMTFQFDPASGVVLSPAKLTVANGACVTFHNATITSAQFAVGAHYKGSAPAFSDATPGYVAVSRRHVAGSDRGRCSRDRARHDRGQGGAVQARAVTQPLVLADPASAVLPGASAVDCAVADGRSPNTAGEPPTAAPPPVQPLVSPPAGSTPYLAGQPTPTPSTSSRPGDRRRAAAATDGPWHGAAGGAGRPRRCRHRWCTAAGAAGRAGRVCGQPAELSARRSRVRDC